MFFTTIVYFHVIKMETIIILAGFIVLLAFLLFFLYREREIEDKLGPITIEMVKPEHEVTKEEERGKEFKEVREKEVDEETEKVSEEETE